MKYLTNKQFLGGVAVLAILVGLYFGYTKVNSDNKTAETTASSQIEETPTSVVPTAPAVNTEETKRANTSAPAVNTEETQVDSIKDNDKSEEATE